MALAAGGYTTSAAVYLFGMKKFDFEMAKLDIWHWKDPLIQPQQLIAYQSIAHLLASCAAMAQNAHFLAASFGSLASGAESPTG